jgi:hypothetical protein
MIRIEDTADPENRAPDALVGYAADIDEALAAAAELIRNWHDLAQSRVIIYQRNNPHTMWSECYRIVSSHPTMIKSKGRKRMTWGADGWRKA